MDDTEVTVDGHRILPLDATTWPAFEGLAGRHNGVFGGCWCTHFHCHPDPPERLQRGNREFKRQRVLGGRAHAAMVFDGDEAIAWAEYGPVEELPNIQHRKQWEAETTQRPDYRITCLFVDRRYRRQGFASIAVRGALTLIADAGGGLIEAYPHDLAPGRKISSSFLYNATRTMYARIGFVYLRSKGAGNCVMTMTVTGTESGGTTT